MMQKEWQENLRLLSNKEVPKKDPKKEKMYNTLRDTFDAFDKDGSAELGFPEYCEAWKFLNRPGGEREMKRTFDSENTSRPGSS